MENALENEIPIILNVGHKHEEDTLLSEKSSEKQEVIIYYPNENQLVHDPGCISSETVSTDDKSNHLSKDSNIPPIVTESWTLSR